MAVRSGVVRRVCHRLLQRLAPARRAIIGISFPTIPWPMTGTPTMTVREASESTERIFPPSQFFPPLTDFSPSQFPPPLTEEFAIPQHFLSLQIWPSSHKTHIVSSQKHRNQYQRQKQLKVSANFAASQFLQPLRFCSLSVFAASHRRFVSFPFLQPLTRTVVGFV